MRFILYADGGSRWNPGPSGCGIFITDAHGKTIEKRYKYLGVATNNVAEYTGALLALTRAIELGATEIELRMDSKLVVEQLSGRYKVKNPGLKAIFDQIRTLLSDYPGTVSFVHVFREQNSEADRLANVAMDGKDD